MTYSPKRGYFLLEEFSSSPPQKRNLLPLIVADISHHISVLDFRFNTSITRIWYENVPLWDALLSSFQDYDRMFHVAKNEFRIVQATVYFHEVVLYTVFRI